MVGHRQASDDGVMGMDELRFPIGPWQRPAVGVTVDEARVWIDEIAAVPEQLRAAVAGLDDSQLDTPYRPEGWTVRQAVHHMPDSHMNAYIRFRNAVTATDSLPVAQPYNEVLWAELEDARTAPVEVSLTLVDALHDRWARMLRSLDQAGLDKRLLHPEVGELTVGVYASCYAWHGKHHIRHITALREKMGW